MISSRSIALCTTLRLRSEATVQTSEKKQKVAEGDSRTDGNLHVHLLLHSSGPSTELMVTVSKVGSIRWALQWFLACAVKTFDVPLSVPSNCSIDFSLKVPSSASLNIPSNVSSSVPSTSMVLQMFCEMFSLTLPSFFIKYSLNHFIHGPSSAPSDVPSILLPSV